MYLIKNALRNITRSKGRNILIGIIAILIAASCCVSLAIRQAAATAEQDGLSALQITATISVDRQSLMKQAQDSGGDVRQSMTGFQSLSLEEMKIYAQAASVLEFRYDMTTSVSAAGNLEPFDTSDATEDSQSASAQQGGGMPTMPGGFQGQENERKGQFGMGTQGDFTLTGYSAHDAMASFVSGTCQITHGVMFTQGSAQPECVVSDELATLNSLSVGDTITLANPNQEEETYDFAIVGIYSNSQSSETGNMMRFSTASDPANQIYTSYEALAAVAEASAANAESETDDSTGRVSTTALRTQTSGTYVFSSLEDYQAFPQQAKDLGLSDSYTVSSTDYSGYEQSLAPLQNLSSFANLFLILTLIIGGVILLVLNIFNIRERKYEVGVLTAIGMKKGKVAAQFVLELLCVTLVSMVIGAAAGAVCSVPVADSLLASQISAQQQSATQREQNFGKGQGGAPGGQEMPSMDASALGGGFMGGRGFAQVSNYVSDIHASINLTVAAQLLLIGLLLTILSSLSAVVFILRYEPLKILTNR